MYFFLRFDDGTGSGNSLRFDLAIGLARHQLTGSPTLLENFARHVDAKTYGDIYGNYGLISNLDEFPNLLQKGSRGIEPVDVLRGVERGNITNWEVWKIDTSFKEKAFFYFNGKMVNVPE